MILVLSLPHLPVVLLLLQAALYLVASAATNYSVDDLDPLFLYFGSWENNTKNLNSTGGNLDFDGSHHLSTMAGSYATITYTCAYLLKVNSIIKSSQPIHFPTFFFLFLFFLDSEVDGLNKRLFAVASVYFCATRWPYAVSTDYWIDENPPIWVDMQDHSVPAAVPTINATIPSGVVGWWKSTANQEHTIQVTIPPNATLSFAVVDRFM